MIFGGTGDLAHRKLLPAIYNLAHEGALPERFNLIAVSRSEMSDDEYREMARESIEQYSRRQPDEQVLEKLLEHVRYVPGTFDDDTRFERLGEELDQFDEEAGIAFNRIFYLSTAPSFFAADRQEARRARAQQARRGRGARGDREAVRHAPARRRSS